MSKLGKIFLWISLVGIIVAGVFGYLVIGKYNTTTTNLHQTQASLEDQKKQTAKVQAEKDALALAKAEVDKALTESKAQVDDLNTKLTDAQKKADDASAALTLTKTDLDKAKADLQHVNEVLGGMSPEEYKAAKEKAESDLAAAIEQEKVLSGTLKESEQKVADLRDAINRKEKGGVMPPGISGRVTFVNRTWNFVVLDVGLANGVVPNGELIVFRKTSFLGKIKVTSAEEHTAVADILPESKGDIQEGDYVLN